MERYLWSLCVGFGEVWLNGYRNVNFSMRRPWVLRGAAKLKGWISFECGIGEFAERRISAVVSVLRYSSAMLLARKCLYMTLRSELTYKYLTPLRMGQIKYLQLKQSAQSTCPQFAQIIYNCTHHAPGCSKNH